MCVFEDQRVASRAGRIVTTRGPRPDGGAEPEEMAVAAAQAAEDKLGRDTLVLSVGELLAITDAFVITHGGTDRQVKAIVEEIEAQMAEGFGVRPVRVEGLDAMTWVLMDYGSFVVHVFDEDTRRFYELERLWKDAPRVAREA